MARNISALKVSGRLDDFQFSMRNGKNFVHMKRDYSKRHKFRMSAPHCNQYRLNLQEFAAAAKIAAEIYRQFNVRSQQAFDATAITRDNAHLPGPILRPYAHNLLTARIKAAGSHQLKHHYRAAGSNHYAAKFTTPDIALALRGLDLSKDTAPAAAITISPLGPVHNPTELKITGITQAAHSLRTPQGIRLECRIHLCQAQFNERKYNPKLKQWETIPNLRPDGTRVPEPRPYTPSDWIPVEAIPEEGIKLPIQPCDEGSKHLTIVFIEWREHRGFGRRIVRLHDRGIARIAAVHAPAAAFVQAEQHNQLPQSHHLIPGRLADHAPASEWQTDPKKALLRALARIQPWHCPPERCAKPRFSQQPRDIPIQT
ncbi:MAG: hypothetical protein U0176_03810 [Bacteroidia bacterium]